MKTDSEASPLLQSLQDTSIAVPRRTAQSALPLPDARFQPAMRLFVLRALEPHCSVNRKITSLEAFTPLSWSGCKRSDCSRRGAGGEAGVRA